MIIYKKIMFSLFSVLIYIFFTLYKLLAIFNKKNINWKKSKDYNLMSSKYNTKIGIIKYFLKEYNLIIIFIYLLSLVSLYFYTSSVTVASTFLYSIF